MLRLNYQLKRRADRLQAKGLLNIRKMACILGTKPYLGTSWREQELLRGERLNDKLD